MPTLTPLRGRLRQLAQLDLIDRWDVALLVLLAAALAGAVMPGVDRTLHY